MIRKTQIFIQGRQASNIINGSKHVDFNLRRTWWKKAWDFKRLIFKVEALLKRSNNWVIRVSWDFVAFVKRRTSSTNMKCDSLGSLVEMWMGSQAPWWTTLLKAMEFPFHTKNEQIGRKRIPFAWDHEKAWRRASYSHSKTKRVEEVTQCMIPYTHLKIIRSILTWYTFLFGQKKHIIFL